MHRVSVNDLNTFRTLYSDMQAVHNYEIEGFSMFKNFIIVKSIPLFFKLLRAKLDKSWESDHNGN